MVEIVSESRIRATRTSRPRCRLLRNSLYRFADGLRNSGEKFFQQAVGQIHRASELRDLLCLPLQLLLNLCGARHVPFQSFTHAVQSFTDAVQSFTNVVELIFDDRKNVGPRHRGTGWASWSGCSRWPAFSACATFHMLSVASLRRHRADLLACFAYRHG